MSQTRPSRLGAIAAVGFLTLAGCRATVTNEIVDREANMLRQAIWSGRSQQVYDTGDASMHKAIDAPTFVKTMTTIVDKLGRPVSSNRQRHSVAVSFPLGRTVTAEYATKFEKGEGIEHITWKLSADGKFVFAGYFVNSPVFAR